MGTFKEFLEKMENDEVFAEKVNAKSLEILNTGDTDPGKMLIAVAEECGYAITEEELNAFNEQQKNKMAELSEEEMGKVAGGTEGFAIASVVVATLFGAFLSISKATDKI